MSHHDESSILSLRAEPADDLLAGLLAACSNNAPNTCDADGNSTDSLTLPQADSVPMSADDEARMHEALLARRHSHPNRQPPAEHDPFEIIAVYDDLVRCLNSVQQSGTGKNSCKSVFSAESLDRMLEAMSRVGGRHVDRALPITGDQVFEFRLIRELGRGAFARVFLAEQADLAARPVVLKLSPIEGTEPQTLAQMQHTNIVPIYSLHDDATQGLRAVCMPYLGGASLSQVLAKLWESTKRPERGAELVAALEQFQSSTGNGQPESDGEPSFLQTLRNGNYVEATAAIVAQLADGLEHAHQRRVLHRDVKPSNVLLSADGQPLLLDFNLAQDQVGDALEATVGGTVSYMAPEHLRALMGRSPELARQVDQRSDIYSLGMVLFEMLTGQRPFDQSGSYSAMLMQIQAMAEERARVTPSLRNHRDDVPWSLESIARKCLAPNASERYQRAAHLAEDLRCFLEDRPLRHAPELSQRERLQKWMRRHPRVTSSAGIGAVAAAALLFAGTALNSVYGRLTNTREQLQSEQAKDLRAEFEAGTVQARCLVNTVVPMQDHLSDGIAACEKTLGLYRFLDNPTWREPSDWSPLSARDRRRLAEDARELLLLLAAARLQSAGHNADSAREALALVDRAQSIPGLEESRALWHDRARYRTLLGETDRAAEAERTARRTPATTAREHYLLATAFARDGGRDGFAQALAELDEAIRLEPRHYWSWTQRGFCHFELGEHLLAAADFGHCTGLWPEFAWGYFNRGRVLDESGKKADAIRDYTAAIERDPDFAAAHINRGLAHLELGRPQEAVADFDRALTMATPEPSWLASRAMALEALGRHAEADAGFESALAAAEQLPVEARQRILWAYGFAVSARLPDAARGAFDKVLADRPDHPQALYGLAMLAMNRNANDEALAHFDSALEANTEFMEARRYRAILLARLGQLERAGQDINRCLEKEPAVGATLYAAACVAARAAERLADEHVAKQALDLLRRSLDRGIELDRALRDPDLAALRQHRLFQELLTSTPIDPSKRD